MAADPAAPMLELVLPDGSARSVSAQTTGLQLAQQIGRKLAAAAVAYQMGEQVYDLSRPIPCGGPIRILTASDDDAEALNLVRHSCAHVMAEAVCRLFPDARLVYGPPVDQGFYYDIDCPTPIRAEDFARIEAEMAAIIAQDRPFTRVDLPREQGMARLRAEGNAYKLDNAERARGDLSFYATGQPGKDFEDLCRGPHVPSTGRIGAFKVTSVAGAYYRGDASLQQLQRVYGKAYYNRKTLEAELAREEEARKRDHRLLGRQLGLFLLSDRVGPGLVLWMPRGAILRQCLEDWLRDELRKRGYSPVYSPHIGSLDLYKTSGHYPYYEESQFPPIDLAARDKADTGYLLKPMNCPHHIQIYKAEPHSYRDLPVRLAEFGTVYRYEKSGELNGMTRVRGFTQDDAHLFCTHDQLEDELRDTVELVQSVIRTLGLSDFRVRFGKRDPDKAKYTGEPALWDRAEANIRNVLQAMGLAFTEEPGEAAFYGPKIDFVVRDVIGREWQLGTVQVDYNLPERFDLEYTGPDNKPHRPVMIHRAPFGSFERFCGILIEHFAGHFPVWLAPVQAVILPVSEQFDGYAASVEQALFAAGLRVQRDRSGERIGARIRAAQLSKVPVMLIVGEKEQSAGTVSLRMGTQGEISPMPLDRLVDQLARASRDRCNDADLAARLREA